MTLIMIVSVLMMFACCPSNTSDVGDSFVYVVALEKEYPDEPDPMWNPTLYKISIEKGEIVKQVKIADQGSPITCESIENKRIRVILHEGTASHGTRPGKQITIEIIINKDTMDIVESKTEQGIDLSNYATDVLRRKRKAPETIISKIPKEEVFLASSSTDEPRLFVLTARGKPERSLRILDGSSFQELESIPLNVGDRQLGPSGFFESTVLFENRFLVTLFNGDSPRGKYAPGYVMIVDTLSKSVKYVAIGSDPALGISY